MTSFARLIGSKKVEVEGTSFVDLLTLPTAFCTPPTIETMRLNENTVICGDRCILVPYRYV